MTRGDDRILGSAAAPARRRSRAPPAAPALRAHAGPRRCSGWSLPLGLALVWEVRRRPRPQLGPPHAAAVRGRGHALRALAARRSATHVAATLRRVVAGFFFGVVAGTAARRAHRLPPRPRASSSTRRCRRCARSPRIAWVPLFILWFGIFETSKIALIAVGVFFPVYLGVMGAHPRRRPQARRGRPRLPLLRPRSWSGASCCRPILPAYSPALRGGPRARLDVRRRGRIHGRVGGPRLPAPRRPADSASPRRSSPRSSCSRSSARLPTACSPPPPSRAALAGQPRSRAEAS